VALAFSSNGYHLAVATDSVVQVRDIRKGKILMKGEGSNIQCVTFDDSGKYLLYGGKEGATIVTAKEGMPVTTVGGKNKVSDIVWTSEKRIVTSGDDDRQVRFYGLEDKDAEMED
jgi:WD40 repeat protein